jgi:hypothetical protein
MNKNQKQMKAGVLTAFILAGIMMSATTANAIIPSIIIHGKPIPPGGISHGQQQQGQGQQSDEGGNPEPPLPDWLQGTMLDGSQRVLITENGQLPEGFNPDDYDSILSLEESMILENEARAQYIQTYGIDPLENLEPVTWEGITWPTGNGGNQNLGMKQGYNESQQEQDYITGLPTPYIMNGLLILYVAIPTHNYRPPSMVYAFLCSILGFHVFGQFQGITRLQIMLDTGHWNADDVGYGFDLNEFHNDISEDLWFLVNDPSEQNRVVLGWISILNFRNGIGGGHFAVCNQLADIEQPPYALATHELSHCFNADDVHLPLPLPMCVMNYFYIALHYQGWCDGCRTTIQSALTGGK